MSDSAVDRYEFGSEWFDLPEHVRHAWRSWARRHGVDPDYVAIPGWIERRPTSRQVSYLHLNHDGEPLTEVRVLQLEAEPSPFPFRVVVAGHRVKVHEGGSA